MNGEVVKSQVYLHASAAVTQAGAVIFLGHSESGKSTVSRIMASQSLYTIDDVVKLQYLDNGRFLIEDGKHRCEKADEMRKVDISADPCNILAVARIYQHAESYAHKIQPVHLCRHLADAVFEVDIQRRNHDVEYRKSLFRQIAGLAKILPGWHLYFSLKTSPETIIRLLLLKDNLPDK